MRSYCGEVEEGPAVDERQLEIELSGALSPEQVEEEIHMTIQSSVVSAGVILSTLLVGAPGYAQEQAYPNRRISMVVGYSPGGFADTLARVVSDGLGRRLNQVVTVENRDGAGGNIAATAISTAAPDGYTILVTTTSIAISQTAYHNLSYTADQFIPVAIPASAPEIIAVPAVSDTKSLKDYIALAKSAGGATFSSAGVGSGSHLAAEYFFKQQTGAEVVHVPFRGGALAVQAAIGNQVDLVAASFGITGQINEGVLRGLAVASKERVKAAPDVPTYAELGFGDYEAASWVGFFVPAGTPASVVEKLNAEINAVIGNPQPSALLTKQGYVLQARDAAETARYFQDEIKVWGERVKALNISID